MTSLVGRVDCRQPALQSMTSWPPSTPPYTGRIGLSQPWVVGIQTIWPGTLSCMPCTLTRRTLMRRLACFSSVPAQQPLAFFIVRARLKPIRSPGASPW